MKTTEEIIKELKGNIEFRIDLYGTDETKKLDSYTYGLIDTLKFIIGKEQALSFVKNIINNQK